MQRSTYKGLIKKLLPNQIFVFGSNTQGRHGKGAALWASRNAGAKYGQAMGLQGNSYAIVTKDLTKPKHPSISPFDILTQINSLYEFAISRPDLEFLIAYPLVIKEGVIVKYLNGYTPRDMASFFSAGVLTMKRIPDNIVFEEEFSKLIKYSTDEPDISSQHETTT